MPITIGPTTEAYQFQESGSNVDFVTELTVGSNPHVVISTALAANDNQMPKDAFVRWFIGSGFQESSGLLEYDLASLTEVTTPAGTDMLLLERSGAPRYITHANLLTSIAVVDLASSPTATTVVVTNTAGTNATIAAADASNAGVMVPAQVNQLDGSTTGWVTTGYINDGAITFAKLDSTAQTNIAIVELGSSVQIASSTGTDDFIQAATGSLAGVMVPAQVNQLDGTTTGWVTTSYINDGAVTLAKLDSTAQTNITTTPAATTVDIESSTGTNATMAAATTSLAGVMTDADKTKLDSLPNPYQNNTTVAGVFPIDASTATFIRLSLTGNAAPGITLPSRPQTIVLMIELNGFSFDWTNMSLHSSVVDPIIVDGQPNFVQLYTDGTNLFAHVGL